MTAFCVQFELLYLEVGKIHILSILLRRAENGVWNGAENRASARNRDGDGSKNESENRTGLGAGHGAEHVAV